jgi:hypothetical protein
MAYVFVSIFTFFSLILFNNYAFLVLSLLNEFRVFYSLNQILVTNIFDTNAIVMIQIHITVYTFQSSFMLIRYCSWINKKISLNLFFVLLTVYKK